MPTISCTEFSRQLSEAVERRESVDTVALREHVAICSACRCEWLDAQLVDRAVAHWKKPVAVAGLTDRILSHVAAETAAAGTGTPLRTEVVAAKHGHDRRTSRSIRRMNRTAGAALTAIALCLCVMLYRGSRPQVAVRQPEVAQNAAPIGTVDAPSIKTSRGPTVRQTSSAAVGAPVELMVADAGSAYLHLAGSAAKAVTAATVLVPSADAAREAPPLPKDEEPWADGMRREIAPVTHQLSHAFEFLIQAVPEKRAPAT